MVWIHQETEDSNLRKEVMQQLQSLGYRARPEYRDASGVATRSVEALYQASSDRVAVAGKHNRNCLSSCFSHLRRWLAPCCGDYIDLSAHQIGCETWQSIIV